MKNLHRAEARRRGGGRVLAPLRLSGIILLLGLCGCAGSKIDRNFRSQVSQVDVTASNTYESGATTDTASAGVDFILRDPSKDGTGK